MNLLRDHSLDEAVVPARLLHGRLEHMDSVQLRGYSHLEHGVRRTPIQHLLADLPALLQILPLQLECAVALSRHLIQLLQELLALLILLLVETLNCCFDLVNRVQFESLFIDRVNQFL